MQQKLVIVGLDLPGRVQHSSNSSKPPHSSVSVPSKPLLLASSRPSRLICIFYLTVSGNSRQDPIKTCSLPCPCSFSAIGDLSRFLPSKRVLGYNYVELVFYTSVLAHAVLRGYYASPLFMHGKQLFQDLASTISCHVSLIKWGSTGWSFH